jgi:predicted permease
LEVNTMRHVTLAVRMLLKSPFVTAIAIISLALGIGANSAIYSLFDQMLLQPLPVHEPQRLVNLSAPGPMPGSTNCGNAGDCDVIFSYPMFRDLERANGPFTGVVAHRNFGASLSINDEPFVADGLWVSGGYFTTLGVRPALGRLLLPSDDVTLGAHAVTVISHRLWRERYGSAPTVLGESIIINGRAFEIVGVTPREFQGTTLGTDPQVYVSLSMRGAFSPIAFTGFENRREYWLYVFARLKPDMSLEQAAAQINTIYRPILNDVEAPLQQGMSDQTMALFKAKQVIVEPGFRGQSSVHAEASTPLMLLFGVTGVVLLIACANIANLLLARGAGRAAEMGVRLALGATRRQLVTQLLIESVLLALVGGALSVVVAIWTLKGISSFMPADARQSLGFALQPAALVFAALLSIGTGLLFGLFPALHSTRSDLISVIRAGAGQIVGGRAAARFRGALVTAQIALSMALLISAGLFLKSLVNVTRADLGITVADVVTFTVSPARVGYDTTRRALLYQRLERELAALPGVTGVGASIVPLLAGNNWGTDVRVQGFVGGPDVNSNSRLNEVSSGYFAMLGVPLIAGREFTDADRVGSTPVAVVNEAFAAKFGLGNDAVGKFMGRSGQAGDSLNIQIVGLIRNMKYSDVKDTVPPLFYTPWRQNARVGAMSFYVRTSLPPEQMLPTIASLLKGIEPALPVEELKTMPQQIKENVFLDRMISILSATFALLATVLAGIGLYGVLAYTVTQRTREIGVRMALGADARRVRGLIVRQVGIMASIGAVIGIAAALGAGRAAQSLLYELEGHDPLTFALAVILLGLIALGAAYVPARRAALVDPMHALRYD